MDSSLSDSSEYDVHGGVQGLAAAVYEVPIENSITNDYNASSDQSNDQSPANTGRVKTSTQRSRECRARQKLLKVCDKKSVKRAKTTAERCKEYRQRQKMLKAAGIQRSPNENAKSPAQRAREYRARLKKKEEEAIALYFQQRRSNPYTSYAPTLLEMDLNESSSSEPVDVKPFIPNPWFALNPTPQSPALDHKPPSIQNEDSSSSTAFTPDENTSFFQFFRGIHSEFLELSARKQRRFKRKCLDFLHELLDDEDTDNQTSSYSHQDNVLNLSNSGHISEEEKDVKPVLEDGYILPNN